ncbi:MAG: hypothetical protein OEU26_21240 [Candidatus Tectomicrobia bacterium]|nr:hypothetical protein [Candidatus Tectomicrobia bacterium]
MKLTQLLSTLAVTAIAMTMLATSAFATGDHDGGYNGECNVKVKKERAYWYRDSHRDEGKFVACKDGYLPISCMIKFPDKSLRNIFSVHEAHPEQFDHDYGCFFRAGAHDYDGHQQEFWTYTVCIPDTCVDHYPER